MDKKKKERFIVEAVVINIVYWPIAVGLILITDRINPIHKWPFWLFWPTWFAVIMLMICISNWLIKKYDALKLKRQKKKENNE